jgi:hypothetical protein
MLRCIDFIPRWYRYIYIACVLIVALIVYACVSTNTTGNQKSIIDGNPYEQVLDAGVIDAVVDIGEIKIIPSVFRFADVPEYKQRPEEMVSEVVSLWEMFFDDDNAPPRDWRRRNFQKYAEYLVQAVLMYQEVPTDIGGKLPKDRNTHLVAAQIVTMESSMRPGVVGVRGEVGLMQVMPRGPAMAGYSTSRVKKTPEIGIRLGVRWLAYSVGKCVGDVDEWSDDDWLGPLSFYSGGSRAVRKNGTCCVFGIAKRRLEDVLNYRKRIDMTQ